MLVALVLTTLASFAAAVALPWATPLSPAAHVHLALAMGVMPLILGAITHFVPVLTRSASPRIGVQLIPMLALATGALTVFSFVTAGQTYHPGALFALVLAAIFFRWITRRTASPLNKPHPCLHWYLAALACLMLALIAVPAMLLWPDQYLALKRLHLHLNTLGFIGLTAIATLQVLLPTAANRFDSQAASRLRLDLKWAFGGTLLVALGAAWFAPLAWLGALMWTIPLARLGRAWFTLHRNEIFHLHGATPSLAAALAGFSLILLCGVLHAGGLLNSTNIAHAFILAFLFPLVSGAVSQLLPVWLHPGTQTPWHARFRHKLGWMAGIRGLLFLAGGMLLVLGWRNGLWLAVAALAVFVLQLMFAAISTGLRIVR